MNMKLRYRLFLRRKSVYYAFDDTTKTFTSLKTKDKAEANRLLMAMNEAGKQPAMNLSLARVYLRHSDPMGLLKRRNANTFRLFASGIFAGLLLFVFLGVNPNQMLSPTLAGSSPACCLVCLWLSHPVSSTVHG
jgi:hypothetical protein